ncbi:MAG: hypothetical protein GX951_03485 [Mollicutes bacterium]|nr:hypothetical protein [Mollicutes bacterium]
MMVVLNSTKNFDELVKYLEKSMLGFNEWTNCFETIYDNNEFDINAQIKILEKKLDCSKIDFNSAIIDIVKKIKKKTSVTKDVILIRDLKKQLKNHECDIIYGYFALVYKICIKKGVPINAIDIIEYENKKAILGIREELYIHIYSYFSLIAKFEIILYELGYDFSSYSLCKIEIDLLNKKYKEMFNGKNIIKDIQVKIKQVNKIILELLDEYNNN